MNIRALLELLDKAHPRNNVILNLPRIEIHADGSGAITEWPSASPDVPRGPVFTFGSVEELEAYLQQRCE